MLLCACCGNHGSGKKGEAPSGRFPYPQIPAMVQGQSEAAEYMVSHFWNRYFASPEKYSIDSAAFEQAFSEYVSLIITAPADIMLPAQDSLMEKAERAGMLMRMASLSDKYLFDPNSPYRNEECYIPVLEKIISSPAADSLAKAGAKHNLPLISLNRIGTVASDFTYTLKNGRTGRMHDIEAERLIMFFSNPGCTSCKEIIDALSSSPKVQEMLAAGRLKILNIYPDADLGEWYKYLPHYPKEWISGFDAEGVINGNTIYYLRAIPSLYLLDGEKRVICKDAPTELVLGML